MTLYAWLCARAPRPVVDIVYVLGRALLIVLVVLYSDHRFSQFAYLQL